MQAAMDDTAQSPGSPDILETFKEKLSREWKQRAACGRYYVVVSKLTQWMTSVEEGQFMSNAGRLLQTVYDNSRRQKIFPPILSKNISDGEDRCLLVFSILLELGFGDLLDLFRTAKICDKNLDSADHHFGDLTDILALSQIQNADRIIEDFDTSRWPFCPVDIKLGMRASFHGGKWVLPFCRRERINEKGGTAELWQVQVQEDLLPPDLQARIKKSRFEDKVFGWCYELALKSYNSGNFDVFDWERVAFDGLRGQKGMVQYIGDFSFDEVSTDDAAADMQRTFNILLEFGELDLDEFSGDTQYPPVLTLEIIEFWRALFKVAEALQKIHNLEFEDEDGAIQGYHGWHADLKPDNILRVHGEFKLADFGFAKFKKRGAGAPMEYIEGGTETYGSPECDSKRRQQGPPAAVSQTIDTWSFGCVLSFAATWVVLGYQGILQFETLRKRAIAALRKRRSDGEQISAPTADDAFHDGQGVLPDVFNWHNYLRRVMRKSDTISGLVLDLVDSRMLVGDPTERITSSELCRRLKKTLDLAEKDYRNSAGSPEAEPIAKTIFEALLDVDEKAPPNAAKAVQAKAAKGTQQEAQTPADREVETGMDILPTSPQHRGPWKSRRIGKSKRLDSIPFSKTAHRTEILQSALAGHSDLAAREEPDSPDQRGTPSSREVPFREKEIAAPETHFRYPVSPISDTQKPWLDYSLDIHRVRRDLENNRKSNFEAKLSSLFKGIKKDEYLKMFIKDRDIKFVVDNATTMHQFWDDVTYTVETLAMKLAGLDDDGLDLIFTVGQEENIENVKGVNVHAKFRKAMDKKRPSQPIDPEMWVKTDMKETLSQIFDEYLQGSQGKRMTLMVFTDGLWEGTVTEKAVEEKIANFVRYLLQFRPRMEDRWFSIEFIRFGDNPKAISRLRRLDDELVEKFEIPDIIDTEPWTGTVRKMILGSFKEEIDLAPSAQMTTGSQGAGFCGSSGQDMSIYQGSGLSALGISASQDQIGVLGASRVGTSDRVSTNLTNPPTVPSGQNKKRRSIFSHSSGRP